MKLEREKDIAALRGKTSREQNALRKLAGKQDRSIFWLQVFMGALGAPVVVLLHRLAIRLWPEPTWPVVVLCLTIYAIAAGTVMMLFYSLFITPRIRRALESSATTSSNGDGAWLAQDVWLHEKSFCQIGSVECWTAIRRFICDFLRFLFAVHSTPFA